MSNFKKVRFLDEETQTQFEYMAKDLVSVFERSVLMQEDVCSGFSNGDSIFLDRGYLDATMECILNRDGYEITDNRMAILNDILISQFKESGYDLEVNADGFVLGKGDSRLF